MLMCNINDNRNEDNVGIAEDNKNGLNKDAI